MEAQAAIAELLANEDVDTVFTLASEEIIGILSEMEDERPESFRVIDCRHEQGAALMADGYSRIDDGIGVCLVGRGPAIAQTGTALRAAANYGSDVLYLVPESRRNAAHDGKRFQQETFLRAMADEVASIRSSETLLGSLTDVIRRIRAGDGPIAVQVPIDVLESTVPNPEVLAEYDATVASGQNARVQPDDAKLEAALDAYLDADATEAPILLAGEGAVRADAKAEIERLAEQMGAYLVTSIKARGHFADHPYYLGFSGDLGKNIANEYLSESGFVLALGCSMNYHTVDKGYLLREEANVVHVDTDPAAIGQYTDVDVGVVGDAKTTAEAFREKLETLGIDRHDEFWTDRVRERIAESTSIDDQTFPAVSGTIDPRDAIRTLDETLPDERLAIVGVGHFSGWVFDGLTIGADDRQIWTADFLALGQAIPFGTGATMAESDRTSMVFVGDGGMMMSLQELETAARYDAPMIVVVMNDEALGAEYHMGKKRGYTGSVGEIPAPDFADVAADFGAEGYTVRSVADIEEIAPALTGDLSGPVVVDCKVNPEVEHRTMGNMEID